MRKIAILALFAACTTLMCSAQRGGGYGHFSRAVTPPGGGRVGGSMVSRQDLAAYRRLYRGGPYGDFLASLGALSDFSGDPSTYGLSNAPPNFFPMPPAASSGMTEDQPRPSAQPLMIELHGDHYVRITNGREASGNDSTAANYQQPPIASSTSGRSPLAQSAGTPIEVAGSSIPPTRAAQDLQAAVVLVFRDGHTESVHDYAITAGKLYARGNYYSDGYWTKTIDLAALNLPATISSNADHGVKFVLPGAPNEVVTRP
jgi:hypothetical protein